MLGVYASPTAAFLRLRGRPRWLLPLVLTVLANLAVTAVSTRYVDWTEQRQLAIERMKERNMTEAQVQQATEGMDRFFGNSALRYGMPLVTSLFTSVISLLFLALVYNVALPLFGASGNFVRALSVVALSGLVSLPSAVVHIALVLARKSAMVSTSLLLAFPDLKPGFLFALLGRIDPFAVWQLVLTGLGLKVVFDVRGSKTWWLVFSVWGVLSLVLALLSGGAARIGR
jgi:hypothetical protein